MMPLRLFFVALQFLTRIPVPRWVGFEPAWLGRCAPYFVPVGALVGLLCAGTLWAASQAWPPAVAVLLAMAMGVWITGGFHEDGLADTFDGLGGAVSRERAMEIMKDSRLGSYGALGLGLVLALKAAVLTALAQRDLIAAIGVYVWAQGLSRALPIGLMASLPYAGDLEHAKAKPLAGGVRATDLVLALCFACGLTLALLVFWGHANFGGLAVGLLMAALMGLWLRAWLRRRLGGYTGDTLGASQQLGELALLLGVLAWH